MGLSERQFRLSCGSDGSDGSDGSEAKATHGLSLNRSAGLALAKRAKKLALDLEAHFDPEGAPSVLIEEGLALWHAPAT